MEIGGGDLLSWPAALLTLALLSALPLFFSVDLIPWLNRTRPSRRNSWRLLQRLLVWAPTLFTAGALLLQMITHLNFDLHNAHVAAIQNLNLSPSQRLGATWSGQAGGMLLLLLSFSILLSHRLAPLKWARPDSTDSTAVEVGDSGRIVVGIETEPKGLARGGALLWVLLLAGMLPADAFARYSTALDATPETLSATRSLIGLLFIPVGAFCFFALCSIVPDCRQPDLLRNQFAKWSLLLTTALLLPAVVLLSAPLQTLTDAGTPFGLRLLLNLGHPDHGQSLSTAFGLSALLLAIPASRDLAQRVNEKWSMGEDRWIGLVTTFGIGFGLLLISGTLLIANLPGVKTTGDSLWITTGLLIPLLLAGFVGALLPLAGFDADPRPEAWGFGLGISVALPFLIISDTDALYLLPGWLLAVSCMTLLAMHSEGRDERSLGLGLVHLGAIAIIASLAMWALHSDMDSLATIPMTGVLSLLLMPAAILLICRNSESDSIEEE